MSHYESCTCNRAADCRPADLRRAAGAEDRLDLGRRRRDRGGSGGTPRAGRRRRRVPGDDADRRGRDLGGHPRVRRGRTAECGADVLVHEACRTTAMRDVIAGTSFETIFSYHADTVPLGAMAERAGVAYLVLTHLIPPPNGDAESAEFAADVRHGGYTGRVSVGTDLSTVTLGGTRDIRAVVAWRLRRPWWFEGDEYPH